MCLTRRYEKSIKRWSHVQQSPQETDVGAKMLDYIAAGDVRRSDEEIHQNYEFKSQELKYDS